MKEPLKIINLTAENIKRLVAVSITPDGAIVEIAGRNGQGKTSVLDCIWWAIEGAKHIQAQPIRKGQDKAFIRLDLGTIVVERRFTTANTNGTLFVTTPDGAKYPKPQDILDDLFGALTFDPLAFSRMKPADQFKMLTTLVPLSVDVPALRAANKATYDERTLANRDVKTMAAQLADMPIPDNVPSELVNVDALIAQLEDAGNHNATIEARAERRRAVADDAEADRAHARLKRIRRDELRAAADTVEAEAVALDARAAAADKALADAPPLPDKIDTAEVRLAITAATAANQAFEAGRRVLNFSERVAKRQADAEALTAKMAERDKEIADALAAAVMPVPGLTLGDDVVLYGDVPLDQASSAEQLRVSLGVAIAANPRLRVIRIQDGSLLDQDSMAIVAEMAEASGFQVWIERVDMSGKVGFVIEDGMVRDAAMQEAAE